MIKSSMPRISKRDITIITYEKCRALYKPPLNFSMDEIADILHISKTTVFFAIKGRSKKVETKIKK